MLLPAFLSSLLTPINHCSFQYSMAMVTAVLSCGQAIVSTTMRVLHITNTFMYSTPSPVRNQPENP